MPNEKVIDEIQSLIKHEMLKASSKFGAFHNAHEGYAVLLEEVDELWDAVKLNQNNPNREVELQHEALHVAAMALRFLYDVVTSDEKKEG